MNQSVQPLTLVKCLLCILSLSLISSIFIETLAKANPSQPQVVAVKFIPPPPPPNRGAPGNRGEGGSRGCGSNQSLMALVPIYSNTVSQNQGKPISITQVWGLTSNQDPTFLFFVPYNRSSIKAMEFVLQNERDKTIYHQPVTIPETPGIVKFHLISKNASLELGKNYHWFFKVHVACEPQNSTKVNNVDGWVQRTNLNSALDASIKEATPQRKVALYAENGIWYDALTTLAELRFAHPKDPTLAADWTSLLKSVGLENLTAQPLVKCCSSKLDFIQN